MKTKQNSDYAIEHGTKTGLIGLLAGIAGAVLGGLFADKNPDSPITGPQAQAAVTAVVAAILGGFVNWWKHR